MFLYEVRTIQLEGKTANTVGWRTNKPEHVQKQKQKNHSKTKTKKPLQNKTKYEIKVKNHQGGMVECWNATNK